MVRAFFIVLATIFSIPAAAAGYSADICRAAAIKAEKDHEIPAGLLQAIALVETGRDGADSAEAWPWTVNVMGKGHYFDTLEDAKAFVQKKRAAKITSIDIGCFQLNLKWHGDAFDSPAAMFNAASAAAYAADFLSRLHKEFGDWKTAAEKYHSRKEHRGRAYGRKIAAAQERLTAIGPATTEPQPSLLLAAATAANRTGGVELAIFGTLSPLVRQANAALIRIGED